MTEPEPDKSEARKALREDVDKILKTLEGMGVSDAADMVTVVQQFHSEKTGLEGRALGREVEKQLKKLPRKRTETGMGIRFKLDRHPDELGGLLEDITSIRSDYRNYAQDGAEEMLRYDINLSCASAGIENHIGFIVRRFQEVGIYNRKDMLEILTGKAESLPEDLRKKNSKISGHIESFQETCADYVKTYYSDKNITEFLTDSLPKHINPVVKKAVEELREPFGGKENDELLIDYINKRTAPEEAKFKTKPETDKITDSWTAEQHKDFNKALHTIDQGIRPFESIAPVFIYEEKLREILQDQESEPAWQAEKALDQQKTKKELSDLQKTLDKLDEINRPNHGDAFDAVLLGGIIGGDELVAGAGAIAAAGAASLFGMSKKKNNPETGEKKELSTGKKIMMVAGTIIVALGAAFAARKYVNRDKYTPLVANNAGGELGR